MQPDRKTDFELTRISVMRPFLPNSEALCKHGFSDGEDICRECYRQRCLEEEARLEASWQRNVIGPMFGWDEEEEPEAVDPPEEDKKHDNANDRKGSAEKM